MSTTDGSTRHLVEAEYGSLAELLEDLQEVTHDLREAVSGQLLVPSDRLEFLTRRADFLAAGAVAHIRTLAIIPHTVRPLDEARDGQ